MTGVQTCALPIYCGLTGWLTFENPKYPRYEMEFHTQDNKKMITMYMDDSRRFSKLKILNEKAHTNAIKKLGLDVFDEKFNLEFFKDLIQKTNKKIVAFIMEQNKFAGIGNYIKNEALYLARIDPHRSCNDLDENEIEELFNNIIFVSYSNCVELMEQNKELKIINAIPANLIIDQWPDSLRVLLYNLIVNSIQNTIKGFITIDYNQTNNGYSITVSDTGVGMSSAMVNYLLIGNKEEEIHLMPKNRKGNGVGFQIIRNLIQLMRAKIDIESTENRGTKVTIFFTHSL